MSAGLGFAIRDHGQHDVDDDIDVDGEGDEAFGVAQFSEGDVLNPLVNVRNEDEEVDIDDDGESSSLSSMGSRGEGTKTLNDLVAEGKVVKKAPDPHEVKQTMDEVMGVAETEELDRAIERARTSGTTRALVEALEKKLSVVVR